MRNNLYEAFEETAVSRIIDNVPQMPDHKFSKRFERKMKKLVGHGCAEPKSGHKKITGKRLFVCVIAAIIAASLMAFSVGAVRETFKKFIMNVFDTHTDVLSVEDDSAPASFEDIYIINVPDGYANTYKAELYEWSPYLNYEYRNGDRYIFFTQFLKSQYDIRLNTENRSLSYIEINGCEGFIVDIGDNEYYISWDNGDYIFDVMGNIDKNALIEIANSVQKVEK